MEKIFDKGWKTKNVIAKILELFEIEYRRVVFKGNESEEKSIEGLMERLKGDVMGKGCKIVVYTT